MKKYLSQLRPMERRLVIGTGVVVLLVLNWWFVWPHFSDWGNLRQRLAEAGRQLSVYRTAIAQKPEWEKQVKNFESQGEFVALDDQAINLLRTIQSQAVQSGVSLQNNSRQITQTNDAFFIEQLQNINVVATEPQLVDFLYKLGSGASMIRVRDLELQPDPPRQRLNANIQLVASYQKNPNPAATAANNPTAMAK